MRCLYKNKKDEQLRVEQTRQTVRFMLIAIAIYLGDKREWRPESICKAIKGISAIAESITGEYTTYKETEQALYEDYGIVVDENCNVFLDREKNKFRKEEKK